MAEDIWTVKRILEWIEGYLDAHGDENPRVSAQWLVSEALGVTRMQLFLDMERPLTPDERNVLRDWTRRRGEGEPLQYITGEVAFRHITVKVRQGVLIPRPETEVLVSEALALLPAAPRPQDELDSKVICTLAAAGALGDDKAGEFALLDSQQADGDDASAWADLTAEANGLVSREGLGLDAHTPDGPHQEDDANACAEPTVTADELAKHDELTSAERATNSALLENEAALPGAPRQLLVADLCTGSGCIACSIAHEHPVTRIVATDISPIAVDLARENAAALGLGERIEVLECDLAEGVSRELLGTFDLVVSNPPYIPTGVLASLPEEVSAHEPSLALDGGPDGLDVYRRLLAWCAIALKPGGVCAFELHETCLDAAAALAEGLGFSDIHIAHDLADRPRILTARKPQN